MCYLMQQLKYFDLHLMWIFLIFQRFYYYIFLKSFNGCEMKVCHLNPQFNIYMCINSVQSSKNPQKTTKNP